MLQQFHNSLATLAESCQDERTTFVALLLKVVESCEYIVHRQACARADDVLVLSHPSVDGGVAVERGIESVAVGTCALRITILCVPHRSVVVVWRQRKGFDGNHRKWHCVVSSHRA